MGQATDTQQGQGRARRVFLKEVLGLSGVAAGTVLLNACGTAIATATAVTPIAQQPTALLTNAPASTAAATPLAEITSTLDQTYFAWYGPTTAGSTAYFRITGPTIVIEFSPQGGSGPGSTAGATDLHIHGMYRDPTNDYGAKYTGIEITS